MEYTKGEWKLTQVASGTITVHADNFTIARLECYGPAQRLQETMINAHLIAAAPDMYEACKIAQEGKGDWRGVIDLALAKAEANQ